MRDAPSHRDAAQCNSPGGRKRTLRAADMTAIAQIGDH